MGPPQNFYDSATSNYQGGVDISIGMADLQFRWLRHPARVRAAER